MTPRRTPPAAVVFDTATFDAVAFDAAGTLVTPAAPVAETYAAAARAGGLGGVTSAGVAARFGPAFAARFGPNAPPTPTAAAEKAAWRAVVADVLAPHRPGEEQLVGIFESLWTHYAAPAAWAVYDDVPAVLAELRRRGVAAGVASNFDGRLHRVLDGHPALRSLAPRVLSGEAGARKPTPGFYARAATAFSLPPHRLLLADDDPANVAGATAAGWAAVRVDRPGRGLAAVLDAVDRPRGGPPGRG